MPDARWARVAEVVAARTGLNFPAERRDDLRRGVAAAAQALGFDDEAGCAAWLEAGVLTNAQVHTLAAHLTVGETYFFRERGSYEVFMERLVPELARKRGDERRLRVWSAGCCTGEEPYSIAMALHRSLPDIAAWDVAVLATDINPRFLARAAAGVYGEWSFRGESGDLRERYFRRTPEGRHAVVREIRKLVKFAPLNLAADVYPSPANGTWGLDAVFCRNVLMYLTPETARTVVAKLHDALADGGWLSVSPAEASNPALREFAAERDERAVFYRKGPPRTDAAAPAALDPPAAFVPDSGGLRAPPRAPIARPTARPKVRKEPPAPAVSPAERARAHADLGELDAALEWCDRWTAEDKLDPGGHYLRALILCEQGRAAEASSSLQRLLFLQPDFVLAHYTLGSLAATGGERAQARRHFQNALALLERCDADAVVPESGGLTAGRLIESVAGMIAGAAA